MSDPGGHVPRRIPTRPHRWSLLDGHLDPDPGAPWCPGGREMAELLVKQANFLLQEQTDTPESLSSQDEPEVTH